jgi:hypothetical protein
VNGRLHIGKSQSSTNFTLNENKYLLQCGMIENQAAGQGSDAGRWLRRRDAWMRLLLSSLDVSRNAKMTGCYLALRLSFKRPFTYPAMKTMGKELQISTRQVARGLKELEMEGLILVRRIPGKISYYSLDL